MGRPKIGRAGLCGSSTPSSRSQTDPGEPSTLGILPAARTSLSALLEAYGQVFDVIGTTAGYWVLENRQRSTWLGTQR